MNEADLELRIHGWLEADADAIRVPTALRRRILDIPAQPLPRSHWWQRFASLPAMSGAAVTAGALGFLAATMFFGLFDAPAGADGEACNNRQVQQALDQLRDSDGYRFVNRQQLSDFARDTEISFENPEYVWTDGWRSEGAYLAPDRARDVMVTTTQNIGPGYVEHLQIGGETFQLREIDGVQTWVRLANWPSANIVHMYVTGAFPAFSIPGVTSLEFGGTPVPDALPGTSGCTAAAIIPGAVEGPAGALVQRIVALRVEVRTGRPIGIFLGPAADAQIFDGLARSMYELEWSTPPAEEFQAPVEFIEDPNEIPGTTPPTPSPLPFDPSAWTPTELPDPAADGQRSSLNAAVAGNGRFVAVGSSTPQGGDYGDEVGVIWTSTDGASWEAVDLPDESDGILFHKVAWDGSTFIAIGRRVDESLQDGSFSPEQTESWLSSDGLSWERGGSLVPGGSGGDLVAGGPGWVLAGAISSEENQIRPAIFTSRDGRRWSTIELPDTASGSLNVLVALPDGGLLATGCESPGATNSHMTGELCLMRPWRSDDGLTWTPGPILEAVISDVAVTPAGFVAVGRETTGSAQLDTSDLTTTVLTSPDGIEWTPARGFPPDTYPSRIHTIGDGLVVDGQLQQLVAYPSAAAWRSADGTSWEAVALALPESAEGSFVSGVMETPSGLAFLGTALIGETGSRPILWLEP